MSTIYDVINEWDLFTADDAFEKLQLSDWGQIDRALKNIYDGEFPGRLGSCFVGAHLATQLSDGAVGPEALSAPALAFDTVWLFDPLYSLISNAASEVWNLLPERNANYFGGGPHIHIQWRPLGHQQKDDKRKFLLREIPPRLKRLRELQPLYESGAIKFLSWEALLLKHKEQLKSSIENLRPASTKFEMKHPQDAYNLGFRLSPIRLQVSNLPGQRLAPGTDLHFVDRTPILLYGLMNTLISTRCGAILQPELAGDADLYEFVMSGLNPTPDRVALSERIELPRFSQAVWSELATIRKDSEALAMLRDLVREAANSEETRILSDIRSRLETAAEKIRHEDGLGRFFETGGVRFGIDTVKGMSSALASTVVAGAAAGGIVGGPAGAGVGAIGGAIAGAGTDFLIKLATRSFDKAYVAKRNRAELFVRIAERLASQPHDGR